MFKSTDCATYNEYICIYGPELGRYSFSSNSDVGLAKNAAENSLQKFTMLQIQEGKHVYYIYTLPFRTEVVLVRRWWIQ